MACLLGCVFGFQFSSPGACLLVSLVHFFMRLFVLFILHYGCSFTSVFYIEKYRERWESGCGNQALLLGASWSFGGPYSSVCSEDRARTPEAAFLPGMDVAAGSSPNSSVMDPDSVCCSPLGRGGADSPGPAGPVYGGCVWCWDI